MSGPMRCPNFPICPVSIMSVSRVSMLGHPPLGCLLKNNEKNNCKCEMKIFGYHGQDNTRSADYHLTCLLRATFDILSSDLRIFGFFYVNIRSHALGAVRR